MQFLHQALCFHLWKTNCQLKIWLKKKFNLTRSTRCHLLYHLVCRAHAAKSLLPMIESCGLKQCFLLCEPAWWLQGVTRKPLYCIVLALFIYNKCQQGPNFTLLFQKLAFMRTARLHTINGFIRFYLKTKTGNTSFTIQNNTTTHHT